MKTLRAALHRNHGFTLAEMLVATIVISGVIASSYYALDAGLAARDVVSERSDALQKARIALEILRADLRAACAWDDEFEFVGLDREVSGADADNLDFASHRWTPWKPGQSDIVEVSFYIEKSRVDGRRALWRRIDPTPDGQPLEGGFREELMSGVEALRFEYSDGFEWYDEWGKQVQRTRELTERSLFQTNDSGLPDAVRVTVSMAPDAKPSRIRSSAPPVTLQTTVFLPLAERVRTASYSTSTSTDTVESADGGSSGDWNVDGGNN